jgi:hypothetical protein
MALLASIAATETTEAYDGGYDLAVFPSFPAEEQWSTPL